MRCILDLKQSIILRVAISLSFLGFILFYSNIASALTLTPIRYEVEGERGGTVNVEVTLLNETENAETYYISYSNFEAQGETGNPNFVDPTYGIGTWMSSPPVVDLMPGEAKTVPITINIPIDAEPGGHFGVVFWGTNPPVSEGNQVAIGAKTGLLVLLSVLGDVKEAGGIAGFGLKENKFFYNTLPVNFEYRFRNDGGDRIKPDGKISIRNTFYLPAEKLNANPVEGNILPGSTRRFEVPWVENPRESDYVAPKNPLSKFFDDALYQLKNFAFGFYFAKLSLSYGANMGMFQESDPKAFFVFPWQLLLVIAFILVIVFYFGGKLLARYNRHIIERAKKEMNLGAK
jgi:hypothetical protein